MSADQKAADPRRRTTLLLVNLASIMEKADEALLPAVYNEVGAALHASPAALGTLTLCRSLVQAACYPLAIRAAARYDRARVIAAGAFLWATATVLVALSSSFLAVALARGLNGVGLALAVPAVSSVVADYTDDSNRGWAFGWLQLTINMGTILGNLFGILMASGVFFGIQGWRVAFLLVAAISYAIAALVWLFAADPHAHRRSGAAASLSGEATSLVAEVSSVIRVPSFQIIVAQGITGSIPWSAFSFGAMWLELMGFSHATTGVLTTLFTIAVSVGSLFGGVIGDPVSQKFPDTGRIALGQISSGLAVPLAAILMLWLPNDPSSAVAHGAVFAVMGFFISWNASSTNNPIFAEIVPEESRTTIYALDKSFEAVFASFAPPVVGVLAESVFGYKPVPSGESPKTDQSNAMSLGKAMFVATAVPFALCCVTYFFLYCTYRNDRERARLESARAAAENGANGADDVNRRLLAEQDL